MRNCGKNDATTIMMKTRYTNLGAKIQNYFDIAKSARYFLDFCLKSGRRCERMRQLLNGKT